MKSLDTVKSVLRFSYDAERLTLHAPRVSDAPRAFTLIEVLVAMTVLSIMVLMVANIFQSSSASWNIGTQKADMNTSARAALDFMVRELESAVAGPIETVAAGANSEIVFNLQNGNDLLFVSLVGDVNDSQALRNGAFYHIVASNQLMYAHQTANPYTTTPSHSGAGMLVANVLSLYIIAFTNEYGLENGLFTENFNSSLDVNNRQLPICVDIALTMLSDDDMQRYNQLSVLADKTAFSDRNSKLYSTRVYFQNRVGYGGR